MNEEFADIQYYQSKSTSMPDGLVKCYTMGKHFRIQSVKN